MKKPTMGEILRLFQAAGFATPTPFQKKLIPLALDGRDVAAQFQPGSGKTAAVLLPLMLGISAEAGTRGAAGGSPRGVRAAILVGNAEEAGKIAREHRRFSRVVRNPPAVLTLGDSEDARREERTLESRAPAIIAGTASRVIDHLRRGSVSLDGLRTVAIETPEGEAAFDFVRDVQFILAKLPVRRQTLLLSADPFSAGKAGGEGASHPADELLRMLRRPVILSSHDLETHGAEAVHAAYEVGHAEKGELLFRILLSRDIQAALVLHSPKLRGEDMVRRASQSLFKAAAISPGTGSITRKKLFDSLIRRELDLLFVQFPLPGECDVSQAPTLVYYDLPTRGRDAPLKSSMNGDIVALAEKHQARELAKLKETYGVDMKNENNPDDADVVKGSLKRIIQKIREEANVEELVRLRGLIRRHVPLFMRSYVTAYLLKSQLTPAGIQTGAEPAGKFRKPGERARQRSEQEARRHPGKGGRGGEAKQAGQLPPRSGVDVQGAQPPRGADHAGEAGLLQLFVSIGRNRRVFPRDLEDFFVQRLGLRADEIGRVRVFDKYSFVEVSRERAQEAISRLSGVEFKGRTIIVNFAKKKEET
jgi:ATP-dependent RNA helicase DeaD